MSAADFSETVESALPVSPLQDSRTDFNVVFIHSRLDDYGLTPPQFRVYAHLARRAGSGAAWPAIATIAATCRLDPKTVRKALRTLVGHKLIHKKERPSETTLYTLTQASDWQPPTHISGQPYQSANPPAKWEGSTTKPHEGQPYQKTPDEGNPIEGNPTKDKTHIPRQGVLPRSEAEAVEQAKLAGVPPEFAISEFNRMEGVGWIDGCQRQVRSWRHYLAQRWSKEQSERQERKARAQARPGRADVLPNGETIPMRRYKLEKQIEEQTREVDWLYKTGMDYRDAQKTLRELHHELETLGQKPLAVS
jgi:hypothetical protein